MKTPLNLPAIDARIRESVNGKEEIFDPLRKKYVALTPEEWVRQHMVRFLILQLGCPASLITVEAPLKYHSRKKRTDIVVHGRDGKPALIVECKSPKVALDQQVLQQAAMYNMPLQVRYVILTNGMQHLVLYLDQAEQKITYRDSFPVFSDLCP